MHQRLFRRLALIAVCAIGFSQHNALAVSTTGCANTDVSCTLSELLAGGSFTAGNLNFSSFTEELYSFRGTPASFQNIIFTPLDPSGPNPLDPGPGFQVDYNDEFTVDKSEIPVLNQLWQDLNVATHISFVDAPQDTFTIKDATLSIVASSNTTDPLTGRVVQEADLFDTETRLIPDDEVATLRAVINNVRDGEPSIQTMVRVEFMDQSELYMEWAPFVFAAGDDGNASLVQSTIRFSQNQALEPETVPEPTTLTLLAGGLLGLAWMKRRRKA